MEDWKKVKNDKFNYKSFVAYIADIRGTPVNSAECVEVMADTMFAIYRLQIPVLIISDNSKQKQLFSKIDHGLYKCGFDDKALQDFLSFGQSGKIFVIDGGDGAGKATQSKMLYETLVKMGEKVKTIDFPHDNVFFGDIIRKVLRGDYGSRDKIDNKMFASLFAVNRYHKSAEIRYWLQRGYNIIIDRYYTANMAYQTADISSSQERKHVWDQILKMELEWLGIPPVDCVIYLCLNKDLSLEAMKKDTSRNSLDILETADDQYKDRLASTFKQLSQDYDWNVINCVSDNGNRKTPHEVGQEIFRVIKPLITVK